MQTDPDSLPEGRILFRLQRGQGNFGSRLQGPFKGVIGTFCRQGVPGSVAQ